MSKHIYTSALCGILISFAFQAHASVVFNFTIDALQPSSVNTQVGDKFSIAFVDDSNFISGVTLADFESISYNTNLLGSDSWVPTAISSPALTEIFNFSSLGGGDWQLDLIMGYTGTTNPNPFVNIVNGSGKNIQWSQFGDPCCTGPFNFGIADNNIPLQQTMNNTTSSFTLSATTVIPVPAAAWLFCTGLLGLIGIARRKKTA